MSHCFYISSEDYCDPENCWCKQSRRSQFKIVCIKEYEFEGTKFKVGDISYHPHGMPIPDKWRKANDEDIARYNSGLQLNK